MVEGNGKWGPQLYTHGWAPVGDGPAGFCAFCCAIAAGALRDLLRGVGRTTPSIGVHLSATGAHARSLRRGRRSCCACESARWVREAATREERSRTVGRQGHWGMGHGCQRRQAEKGAVGLRSGPMGEWAEWVDSAQLQGLFLFFIFFCFLLYSYNSFEFKF
jgi:hypothetical protein